MTFEAIPAIAAILSMVVPGFAMGFALLRGVDLNRFDKLFFGAILGIITVPLLSFLEYLLLGMLMSAQLVFANSLLVLLASLAAYYLQANNLAPNLSVPKPDMAALKKYWPYAVVLLLIAIGFYIRFVPGWSTTFYEFDPYYYEKLTERLVQNGQISMFTSDSYYPLQQFQHWPPMMHYLTGAWVFVHNLLSGQAYDKDTLILISQIYPPLVGALMVFLAYVLIREEYNEYYGLVAAAMFAFTPQMIKKLSAGVAEQQPWTLFVTLLFFALVLMALKRKSYRLAAVAGLASIAIMLGGQQYIWPALVFAAFVGLQGILYFLRDSFDDKKMVMLGGITGSFLIGTALIAFYQNQQYVSYLGPHTVMLLGAFVFTAVLYGVSRSFPKELHDVRKRALALGGIGFIGIAAASFTPILSLIVNTILGQARTALTSGALAKTIAEEGRTYAGLFQASYGILNPPLLLMLAALTVMLTATVVLARKNHVKFAGAFLLTGLVFIFLNAQLDTALTFLFGGMQNEDLQTFLTLFMGNDVFGYMVIALASTALLYLTAPKDENRETSFFLALVFFPVAFIGLNKLKYIVHLGFSLALVFPYVLGEAQRLVEEANDWLKAFANKSSLRVGMLYMLMLVGVLAAFVQSQTVGQSMNELQNTRLPQDWVDTYKWMRANAPADARFMSWWDYGHWTTFFGERNTVLNPTNLYADFDQGVARAFVNGNDEDLYSRMEYHNATHVLLDGDLIGKWGALVFLSGSCSSKNSQICPEKPEIDYQQGPGKSQYEVEHYFEQLGLAGNCPASALGVPLPMLQSALGAKYCLTQDQYIYLGPNGQMTNTSRPYKLVGRDQFTAIEPGTSYLFSMGNNNFLNVNPYYEPFGLHNTVFKSAFTKMFFFESMPGFKTVYRSPSGYIKLFEYTGRPGSAKAIAAAAAEAAAKATPTPSPTPTATTTPGSATPAPTASPTETLVETLPVSTLPASP